VLNNPPPPTSRPADRRRLNFYIALAAGILGGALLCGGLVLAGSLLSTQSRQPEQDRWQALAPLRQVCGGAGQAQAARYAPGAGPHRLAVFRSNIAGSTDLSTFYNRTEDFPAEWQPAELAHAALVACVHTGSVVVEECAYTLDAGARATLQRVQLTAMINLYAASTGELVGQETLTGPEPRACQAQEQFLDGSLTQPVFGEAVCPAQIQGWLTGYVE
jgi:hypothetical protein